MDKVLIEDTLYQLTDPLYKGGKSQSFYLVLP